MALTFMQTVKGEKSFKGKSIAEIAWSQLGSDRLAGTTCGLGPPTHMQLTMISAI